MSLSVSIQYCAATRRFNSNSKIVAHIPMGRIAKVECKISNDLQNACKLYRCNSYNNKP